MNKNQFHQLWAQGIKFLDALSSSWMHEVYSKQAVILRSNNIEELVHTCYEGIKKEVKKNYFLANDDTEIILNRYKRAAVLSYAILEMEPFIENKHYKAEIPVKAELFNEYFAFYLGLHSLLIDYPKEELDSLFADASKKDIFHFPLLNNNTTNDIAPTVSAQDSDYFSENSYVDSVAKEFQYCRVFNNFNLLSVADKYFLLYKGFSYICP